MTLFNVNKCRPLWLKIKLAEHAGIALADQVNHLRRKTPAGGGFNAGGPIGDKPGDLKVDVASSAGDDVKRAPCDVGGARPGAVGVETRTAA